MPETLVLNLIPTYTAISKHSKNCRDRGKGQNYLGCNCRKWLLIYDPRKTNPAERQEKYSLKTRDGAAAERIAQLKRDQHNPDKVRAAQAEAALEAERNRQKAANAAATIEQAVAQFLVFKRNNPARRTARIAGPTAESTMEAYKHLLGEVDPKSFEVVRKGRLFTWLETLSPRPVYISDLTHTMVDDFRATWNFPSDLTTATTFTRLKTFFVYCRDRGRWIKDNPVDGITRIKPQEGSRTTAFTDEQYSAILRAIEKRIAAAVDDEKEQTHTRRLRTLVELMRWGGLALHDAVDFKRSSLKGDLLEYRRAKTNRLAKPVLPHHVVELLRTVVPINGDSYQPFRDLSVRINSDKNYWSRQLKELFVEAGIKTVQTEIRTREPHAHMLRDTFAVGQLERHIRGGDDAPTLKSIADAMGDSVQVMLKHYAPVMEKLDKAHAEKQRKVVAAQIAEQETREKKPADIIAFGGRK